MITSSAVQAYSSYYPVSARTSLPRKQNTLSAGNDPPRKPDWLLIMVGILFLLSLLIAWLADVPVGSFSKKYVIHGRPLPSFGKKLVCSGIPVINSHLSL